MKQSKGVDGDLKPKHEKNHKQDHDGPKHRHWSWGPNLLKQTEKVVVI